MGDYFGPFVVEPYISVVEGFFNLGEVFQEIFSCVVVGSGENNIVGLGNRHASYYGFADAFVDCIPW